MKKLVVAALLASRPVFADGLWESMFDKARTIGQEKTMRCPSPGVLQIALRNQESGACGQLIRKGQLSEPGFDMVQKIAETYAREAVKIRMAPDKKDSFPLKNLRIVKGSQVAELLKRSSESNETNASDASSSVLREDLLGLGEEEQKSASESPNAKEPSSKASDFVESIVFTSARTELEGKEFDQSVFAVQKIPGKQNVFHAQVRMFVAFETETSSKKKPSPDTKAGTKGRMEIFEVQTDFRLGFKGVNDKDRSQSLCEVIAVNSGSCYMEYSHR
ncbi:MAG: hypothetical protein WCH11_04475, partial [Bdellovibrio sp.]